MILNAFMKSDNKKNYFLKSVSTIVNSAKYDKHYKNPIDTSIIKPESAKS